MSIDQSWEALSGALRFAIDHVEGDPDPLNDRERADGHQYVVRALTAVLDTSLLMFDPEHPAFMPMMESVRYVGAAGPDIDYDVAIVMPGVRHRITGLRGGASYVGVTVYGHAGDLGASSILASVDVDDIVRADGTFEFEFDDATASRVIIRQYFHDRTTQPRGEWSIAPVGDAASEIPARRLPTEAALSARLTNAAQSFRWNLQLNTLWSPERRATPNEFIRQTAHDVIAAIPNPDVNYSFSWWKLNAGESLVIEVTPPSTRYWSLQVCDRWFQCFPDRRSNVHNRQVMPNDDGSVRIVLSENDPGTPNWVETSGHSMGIMFFRWLHSEPAQLPTCTVTTTA